MSNSLISSLQKQIPHLPPQDFENLHPNFPSIDEKVYTCICKMPDTSINWICCDNPSCPIGWYHWECVSVTKAVAGQWFCPSCRPTTMTGEAAKKKNKKGIAVKKKSPAKKGRSKWVGWVEVESGDEGEGDDGNEDEDEEGLEQLRKAVVLAKTRQTMMNAMKSGGRVRDSRICEASPKHVAHVNGEPEKWTTTVSGEEMHKEHPDDSSKVNNNKHDNKSPQYQRMVPQNGVAASTLSPRPSTKTVDPRNQAVISSAMMHAPVPSQAYTRQAPVSAVRSTLPRLL